MISLNATGRAHNECVPTVADLLSKENQKKSIFNKIGLCSAIVFHPWLMDIGRCAIVWKHDPWVMKVGRFIGKPNV